MVAWSRKALDSADQATMELIKFDPVGEAEKLLGESVNNNDLVQAFSFSLQCRKSDALDRMMKATGDVRFGCDLASYLKVAVPLGFETVLEQKYPGRLVGSDKRDVTETLLLMFEKLTGSLLFLETYDTTHVNHATLYYNWQPIDREAGWTYMESGGFTDEGVLAGYHDVRQGLALALRQLSSHGRWITPWVKRPGMWLVAYCDVPPHGSPELDAWPRLNRSREITKSRLRLLPDEIQSLLGPEEE